MVYKTPILALLKEKAKLSNDAGAILKLYENLAKSDRTSPTIGAVSDSCPRIPKALRDTYMRLSSSQDKKPDELWNGGNSNYLFDSILNVSKIKSTQVLSAFARGDFDMLIQVNGNKKTMKEVMDIPKVKGATCMGLFLSFWPSAVIPGAHVVSIINCGNGPYKMCDSNTKKCLDMDALSGLDVSVEFGTGNDTGPAVTHPAVEYYFRKVRLCTYVYMRNSVLESIQ